MKKGADFSAFSVSTAVLPVSLSALRHVVSSDTVSPAAQAIWQVMKVQALILSEKRSQQGVFKPMTPCRLFQAER